MVLLSLFAAAVEPQPSRARSGYQISCCLVSLRFLCDIHSIHSVHEYVPAYGTALLVEVGVVAHAAAGRAPAPAEQHQPAPLVAAPPVAGRSHFMNSPEEL